MQVITLSLPIDLNLITSKSVVGIYITCESLSLLTEPVIDFWIVVLGIFSYDIVPTLVGLVTAVQGYLVVHYGVVVTLPFLITLKSRG